MKIKSQNIYINEHFEPAVITLRNGKIENINYDKNATFDIDFGYKKILPGFIDIHCHGYQGYSTNVADAEGLDRWTKHLPYEGCTSFLATTSTTTVSEVLKSISMIREKIEGQPNGSRILGIHVEGPYISFEKCGAHNKYELRKPSATEVDQWEEVANNHILLYCIAPEMDVNHEMIKHCVEKGIKVAVGHTNASYEEAMSAVQDGANDFTHTYNAMTELLHRKPGVVGAAMDSVEAYSELITDGIHVKPAACRALAKIKGKDKLILVTDAVDSKGLKPGEYGKGEDLHVVAEDGTIRKPDGTLAGSSASMNQLVGNAIRMGIDETTAINAATKNPSNFMGFSDRGLIEPGKIADLVIVDDDYHVIQTYCEGYPQI